ncbi:DNA mismatch repair protein MutL [Rhizopogon salebrosus TDB-379]|nr:DNA mismatch repair protein MutL [Rhizopogon salebrosus TDB-379]
MARSSHDSEEPTALSQGSIRAIDGHSVHRITSGQVVIDLQTAVKELVENSLDAGATNIAEVRFLNYGLKTIEVVDNGCGIAPKDYESVALKHHTSKLAAFEDLSTVLTFGFRGEALSSLCALSDGVTLTTATVNEAPMGTILEMDRNGKLRNSNSKIARQRGTTVAVSSIFKPLPVRRKELERNVKREFGKALNLLYAYALVPCASENRGVRLAVSNQPEGGRKTVQLKTNGIPSVKASVTALWGTKALDNVVDLDLSFDVHTEKSVLRRLEQESADATPVKVRGLISKFAVGAGRTGSDRQYFYINGRPCNPGKVIQKAFNEVYKSFSAGQFPLIVADFILPTRACDVNVSPDKRTIFLHSEQNLIQALKVQTMLIFLYSFSHAFKDSIGRGFCFVSFDVRCWQSTNAATDIAPFVYVKNFAYPKGKHPIR